MFEFFNLYPIVHIYMLLLISSKFLIKNEIALQYTDIETHLFIFSLKKGNLLHKN